MSTRDVKLSQEKLNPNCQRIQMGTSRCIELSGSTALASENCNPSEDATNLPGKWPQSTPLDSETFGDAKKQDTDGKTDHTADVEQMKPSSTCSDQNGLDQMDSSTSGRNVQENELAKQDSDDLTPCSLSHLITHSGTGNSAMSISDLAIAAQPSWEVRSDNIISSTSFLALDQRILEDSRRELYVEPIDCYTQKSTADTAGGVATNHNQEILPGVIQNQLVSNDYIFDTFKVSVDSTVMENPDAINN